MNDQHLGGFVLPCGIRCTVSGVWSLSNSSTKVNIKSDHVQNDIINSVPGLKFDYEVGTNIMYVDPLQISVDPRICVINKSLVLNFENQ